jgi:MFS family permease
MFAVVNQVFGREARRGVTALTMVTGLAGTVYVPFLGALVPLLDWRATLLVLAALNLGINAPAHWLFIPPRTPGMRSPHAMQQKRGQVVMRRRLSNPVFWGLTLWYTSYSLTSSSLFFQFVPLLRAEHVADAITFFAFALIGPVQLVARLLVITLGHTASTARLGAFASSLVPFAVLVLIFAPHSPAWLCLFAALFATGHGITTILRGTLPIEWLGHEHFARTMGAIALPMMVAMALAPTLTALAWSLSGSATVMLWTIFAGSLFGTVGYWLAVLARRRRTLTSPPDLQQNDDPEPR